MLEITTRCVPPLDKLERKVDTAKRAIIEALKLKPAQVTAEVSRRVQIKNKKKKKLCAAFAFHLL